jgi:hypothetical protein
MQQATISERMAKALAEWRTAKYLLRAAQSQFNVAVDAHRDDPAWSDALRQEIAALRDAVEAAKRPLIAADEGIQRATLYDRQEWIHGNGRRPSYV